MNLYLLHKFGDSFDFEYKNKTAFMFACEFDNSDGFNLCLALLNDSDPIQIDDIILLENYMDCGYVFSPDEVKELREFLSKMGFKI